MKLKILFVCSRNQWRSPTAEEVWKDHPQLAVRSGGTSPNARRTVNHTDIRWADQIVAMEKKHRDRLQAKFPALTRYKTIHVLDIPDEYKFMDPELAVTLEAGVAGVLGLERD